MTLDRTFYLALLTDVKARIWQAQQKATLSVNAELIQMYWDIGRIILARQTQEGWGAAVIPRLSQDLRGELAELKGFSERNIGYMIRFAREYGPTPILQQPVAKLSGPRGAGEAQSALVTPADQREAAQSLVTRLPWGHNILLMEKVKSIPVRIWYMQQTLENGWSRDTLSQMIKTNAHDRHGKATSNFAARLPEPQSDLVRQTLKDPYIFDFLTLENRFTNANSKPVSSATWKNSCSNSARALLSLGANTISTLAAKISTSTCCSTTSSCAASSSSNSRKENSNPTTPAK